MPSKFVPAVADSLSVDNFDTIWTTQPAEDSPCGTPPGAAAGADAFRGFTYVAPSLLVDSVNRMHGAGAAAALGAPLSPGKLSSA